MSIPYLNKKEHSLQLMVHDEPWIALAGEVHNSSCSDLQYFQTHVLDQAKDTNVNTLLLPIYWDMIEPEENVFDFTSIERILPLVRDAGFHVVFLWFGLWKNGLSTYIPAWMKLARSRFPFAQKRDGTYLNSISPFCEEAVNKDAYAFGQVMKKIKELDEKQNTVIMVQVENEIGLLDSDRDYGEAANSIYLEMFPQMFTEEQKMQLTKNSSIQEEELFMAIAYANAIEKIARTGKKEYPLPMYVNAWLKKENEKAGKYPSGGPHQDNLLIYQKFAPHIDFCAPDVYVEDATEIFECYGSDILCIPETRQDPRMISYGMYVFGKYQTICFSPFGIEDIWQQKEEKRSDSIYELLGIQKNAFQPEGTLPLLEHFYHDMEQVKTQLLRWREEQRVYAFIQNANERKRRLLVSSLCFHIYYYAKEECELGAGWIVAEEDTFIIYLRNCAIQMDASEKKAILSLEEGSYQKGIWKKGRVLNGDEQYQIIAGTMPKFFRLRIFDMEP